VDAFALHVRGIVLEALGRQDEALDAFEQSLKIAPQDAAVRLRLARLRLRRGDVDGAEREIVQALRVDPSNAEAHRGRARVLQLRGREAEALAELRESLHLDPGMAIAMGDLAWILAMAHDASLRDPRTAVELGESAARATGERGAGILDALAAAYAASGRFHEAVATAEKALARAGEARDADLAARVEKRLIAYRAGTIDRGTPR
jgi:tetratricopeptide (TPR) repeat protein